MKHLLVLFILLPTLAYGQKFDITGQAGASTTSDLIKSGIQVSGFSYQLSVG